MKGQILDFGENIMIVFIVGLLFFLGYFVIANMNTAVQSAPDNAYTSEGLGFFANFSARIPKSFDSGLTFLFFGLIAVLLGMSWFLASNAVVFFIFFFVSILFMAFSGFLANAWLSIMAVSSMSAAATNFPLSNFIFRHYLVFSVIQGFLMLIIFFAKPDGDGG